MEGLKTFLETAAEYKKLENMSDVYYICCPCVDYCNEKMTQDIEEIREHLLVRGFMSGYTIGWSTMIIRRLWEVMTM
jgi:hypothetical protein